MDGSHERQTAFMEVGGGTEERWDEDYNGEGAEGKDEEKGGSRDGKWESGKGRCAVTGRRLLAGTDGLRRVMV